MDRDFPLGKARCSAEDSSCRESSGVLWASGESVEIPSLACDIEPKNLEKRVRAIIDLLSDPGSSEKYVRKMADTLGIRCINEGRQDLATIIFEAMALGVSSEQRKINQEKKFILKQKVAELF